VKLFTPRHVLLITLLGGPLGGAMAMAANYRAFNDTGNLFRTLGFGVVGTLILMTISVLLPENVPGAAIAVGIAFACRILTEQLQGPMLIRHLEKGATPHNGWRVAGTGIAALLATLPMALLLALILE
jgi:hypothetical protein